MTDLEDRLLHAHQAAVAQKEEIVRTKGRDGWMPLVVVGYRGSHQVALFFCKERDEMLDAMGFAVGAFSCDLVTGTTDSYSVMGSYQGRHLDEILQGINPDTGQQWAQGDMERAFRKGRPWVGEGLSTSGMDRVTQRSGMVMQNYRATGRKISWLAMDGPHFDDDDKFMLGGVVPEVLRQFYSQPDLEAVMRKALGIKPHLMFGLTAAQQRAHADAAALRFFAARDVPILYQAADDEAQEIVDRSLSDTRLNAQLGAPGIRVETWQP